MLRSRKVLHVSRDQKIRLVSRSTCDLEGVLGVLYRRRQGILPHGTVQSTDFHDLEQDPNGFPPSFFAAGLLLTDPAASCIRPTRDVDVIVEVTSRRGYSEVEKALAERGFKHDAREGAPICRWVLDSVILDVMPTDSSILGFSNPWYAEAFKTSVLHILPGGLEIRLVSPPCFLATKLEAFFGRGQSDYYGSHDLEDLVAVIDGRPEIVAEVHAADPVRRKYLKQAMEPLLQDPQFCYALQGHLPGDSGSQARLPELMRWMKEIAGIPTTNSLL